ncbi:hypothetical protein GN278_03740 [Rhodobacteraceae bacterium Araon29]
MLHFDLGYSQLIGVGITIAHVAARQRCQIGTKILIGMAATVETDMAQQ